MTVSTKEYPPADLHLYGVTDVMRMLRMSRAVLYQELRAGRLRSVKRGTSRLFTAQAIRDYITLLERESEKTEAA